MILKTAKPIRDWRRAVSVSCIFLQCRAALLSLLLAVRLDFVDYVLLEDLVLLLQAPQEAVGDLERFDFLLDAGDVRVLLIVDELLLRLLEQVGSD